MADATSPSQTSGTAKPPATTVRSWWRSKTGRTIGLTAAVLALAAGGFALFANRTVAVPVARPEASTTVRVFGLGTVEARVTSKASFEVGAAIVAVNADHGDRVKKGAVLARLHATEQEAKVARAKALVAVADVSQAKALANVEKTAAVLAQKQEANKRKQSLVGRNVVSEQSAEEAIRDEAVAKADLSVAKSEVEVAKAQMLDVRAQLAYEQSLLDHHVLTAPFDALVVDRLKEVGTVIKAGDPVFTLIDPESVWALAYVDESRAGRIKVGQAAHVRLRSLPQEVFEGQVVRIGIESDRVSEERRIWVKCLRCPETFHLGEQAEVYVTTGTLTNALLVPEAVVEGFDGRQGRVWTIENGRLARRVLQFGHRTEDSRLEVTGGLPASAQIVTELGPGLRPGRSARAKTE